jgi:hypothetical protein
MSHSNSILMLRLQELTQSTRTFRARGSKVIRCDACLLPQADCICAAKPTVFCRSAFCFLMYKGEAYKPSNTGRLIADVAPDNHAFLWQRTEFDPRLLALLQDARYAPVVVFPHEYAEPQRRIYTPLAAQADTGKIPLFIMLDGTWREAKKMFKSPYLADLPVLGIQPIGSSRYLMRDAAMAYQLCTAEVGIEVLKLAQEMEAAKALEDYFAVFCRNYAVIKPHLHEKRRP